MKKPMPDFKGGRPKAKKGSLKRIIKLLIRSYPILIPIAAVCIIISSVTASLPAIFQQQVLSDIGEWVSTGDWVSASKIILPKITILASLYFFSLCANICYTQLMAFITQGFLNKMRRAMFEKMQNLPIRYFDTNCKEVS